MSLFLKSLQSSLWAGTRNAPTDLAMRLAIPHWQDRISPVLDVAGALFLVDIDHGMETGRQNVAVQEENPLGRAKHIEELGVNVLICGAISWPLELALASAGIEIIPQTCGEVEQVLDAFLTGRLEQEMYLMPGCCGRRRRFRGGRHGDGGPT